MAKKQITQREAKEKYGIVISKMQHYNNYKFFLFDNGDVVDSDGDIRYQKPKCWGDYQSKSQKWLMNREDKLEARYNKLVGKIFTQKDRDLLDELLEVERELTLREEDPR